VDRSLPELAGWRPGIGIGLCALAADASVFWPYGVTDSKSRYVDSVLLHDREGGLCEISDSDQDVNHNEDTGADELIAGVLSGHALRVSRYGPRNGLRYKETQETLRGVLISSSVLVMVDIPWKHAKHDRTAPRL
jgi:hypothetical protein